MKRFALLLAIVLTACFLIIACSKDKTAEKETPEKARVESLKTTPADIGKEAKDLAETSMRYTQERITDYQKKVMEKMDDFQAKQQEISAELAKMNENARTEMAAKLDELKQKKTALDEKILEMIAVSSESFDTFKADMNKAVEDLEKEYDETLESMKKK